MAKNGEQAEVRWPLTVMREGLVYYQMDKQGTLRATGEAYTEYRFQGDGLDARVYVTPAGRVVPE